MELKVKSFALLFPFVLLAVSAQGMARSVQANEGREFPVRYEKYGVFHGRGTADYEYEMTNRAGLRDAVGPGLFPSNDIHARKVDPQYEDWAQKKPEDFNAWDYVNTDDPQTEFYAWTSARGVSGGTRLLFQGNALLAAGKYKMALKAYYAALVHFPKDKAWSEDRSFVWYPGEKALSQIHAISRGIDSIRVQLKGAEFKVVNGYDGNPDNDVVIVDPGEWVPKSKPRPVDLKDLKIIQRRGEGKVQVVQYDNGDWVLMNEGEPFFVRGVNYGPTKVGDSIQDGEGNRWMFLDLNENGKPDGPYDSWIDEDGNGTQELGEPVLGDFEIMQRMGANALKVYRYDMGENYNPDEFNKKLMNDAHRRFGLQFIMGDFLGAYTIGSGASWEEGTDYTDKKQKAQMKRILKAYVEDHKDEPYVLMWMLGNENLMPADYSGVNATRTQAATQVEEYLTFLNEMADMIHELDPDHPVAIGNLGLLYIDEYAKLAPAIDIFGLNAYLGSYGFGHIWTTVDSEFNRPVLITEYGCDAFDSRKEIEDEKAQAFYHKNAWQDIWAHAGGHGQTGNSIGGVLFEFLDEWWKSQYGSWRIQDKTKDSPMAFPDGWSSEEFLGVFSQGDGSQSPFYRRPRETYFLYRDQLWTKPFKLTSPDK